MNKRYVYRTLFAAILFMSFLSPVRTQVLKSIVYDFDGFDLAQTSLPEGDYSYGDLQYQVSADPLPYSPMIGDRCLRLNINWQQGYAAFGRGISRYIEMDPQQDRLNFYFYNPPSNAHSATVEIAIADDDNQNQQYEAAADDSWRKTINISGGNSWQLVSVPLKDFSDSNPGGNGVFDIAFTQNKGMLLLLEFRFDKGSGQGNAVYYMDMICFTEGSMPHGTSITSLPSKTSSDFCRLGAFQPMSNGNHHLIPSQVEGLFPAIPQRTLTYVNTYLQFANNGSSVPHALPGTAIQTLLDKGYQPIITWEPQFLGYAPLDPVQPRLQNIIDGDYDSYIDLFADKIKGYKGTVIIRLMHEFDGNWYSWCISQNGNDPAKFVAAWQKIVNRFKAKNVSNVKWMWCGNSDYAPYEWWNWLVKAYPGDSYVDYVATDVYNNIHPKTLPWWKSFRWHNCETYYYLTKYFPTKPFIVCELGARERTAAEVSTSQNKAQWYQEMDRELKSNFRKVRGLIFFNTATSQDWRINTSLASLQSIRDNLWWDDYYFENTSVPTSLPDAPDQLQVFYDKNSGLVKPGQDAFPALVQIFSCEGKLVFSCYHEDGMALPRCHLQPGVYLLRIKTRDSSGHCKFVVCD